MLRTSRRAGVVLTAAAVLMGASLTGTAVAQEPGSLLGPVIDADVQLTELRQISIHSNGVLANTPDPGSKAISSETDLAAYPKFTEKELAERVAADRKAQADHPPLADAGEVRTTEQVDGGVLVSLYTPLPGVTPERLADSLRTQGKKDVQIVRHNDQPPAQTMAPGDCAFGQARSFSCPVSFWTNNGFEDPLVRFNDHSSAAWPATNAVYKWNQTPNIDSAYRWNSCPFLAGARCVDVNSGNYGNTIWVGRWSAFYPTPTHSGPYRENGQWIQLNDYHPPNGFTRNMVVTHEMGHALGLGHNMWSGDVMYAVVNMREDIGGENPALLASIYSIYR